ncbi:MAG: hypothetical protein EOO13_07185 [Chitinophagaceae bacterium]|nr:MAG: hypothetical protein EOO13_07185 [Chitinophagaceae bacterium]
MKKNLLLLVFAALAYKGSNAQVENTSYINSSNEKVLQFSMVLPVHKKEAWKYFSEDEKLVKWIAPVAHIELKNGGSLVTNYDKTKPLTDSSAIALSIPGYLAEELIIFKVELNNYFSKKLQAEDQYLQEFIRLEPAGAGKTRIISSMTGWGSGTDWDKAYFFFEKGNKWTYQALTDLFK